MMLYETLCLRAFVAKEKNAVKKGRRVNAAL